MLQQLLVKAELTDVWRQTLVSSVGSGELSSSSDPLTGRLYSTCMKLQMADISASEGVPSLWETGRTVAILNYATAARVSGTSGDLLKLGAKCFDPGVVTGISATWCIVNIPLP